MTRERHKEIKRKKNYSIFFGAQGGTQLKFSSRSFIFLVGEKSFGANK